MVFTEISAVCSQDVNAWAFIPSSSMAAFPASLHVIVNFFLSLCCHHPFLGEVGGVVTQQNFFFPASPTHATATQQEEKKSKRSCKHISNCALSKDNSYCNRQSSRRRDSRSGRWKLACQTKPISTILFS